MNKVKFESNRVSTAPVVIDNLSPHLDPMVQRVAIVMATYNGSRFIEEQIQSFQAQSYAEWVLYVRDDGSRDDTVQKVMHIARKDHRVRLVKDQLGNLGAMGNFSTLMKIALQDSADYIFFSDQDDVWYPEKLTTMLNAMRELGSLYGEQTPLLVHCDLSVVNEKLESIDDSFMKLSTLTPTTADFGVLLCQNQVTGCACVINRALLELAFPIPPIVAMHDWWLALLASSTGKIGFVPKPLVKYRQHAGNVIGAMSLVRRIAKLFLSPRQWMFRLEIVRLGIVQAAMLEERVQARGIELPPNILKQMDTYSHILNVSPIKRLSILHAQKIGRTASSTKLAFTLLITTLGRKREVKKVA